MLIGMMLFFSGLVLIDKLFGYHQINFILREDGTGSQYGLMSCTSNESGKMLVNSRVNCSATELFNVQQANVTFTYDNGTTSEPLPLDAKQLDFTAPPHLSALSFKVIGRDKQDILRNLSTGWSYTFYSPNESTQRRDDLITYLLALLGLIAFSIPQMMVNFNKLYKKS